MLAVTALSERRACQLVGLSRSTLRYEPRRSAQNERLSAQIIELAQVRRRFGYRRIHALLRRDGIEVNHKRVYRLYSEAELSVKRRKRRRGVAVPREPLVLPTRPNEVWSMDFVMDALYHGRRIKILATAIWIDLATHSGRGSSQHNGNRTDRVTSNDTARDLLSFPEGQCKPRARSLRRSYAT